jgi:hypothetical protein
MYIKLLPLALVIVLASSCQNQAGAPKVYTQTIAEPMQKFMNGLDGNKLHTEDVLNTYAGTDEKNWADMDFWSLTKPQVSDYDTTFNCYTLQANAGKNKREYKITWDSTKITNITDNGIIEENI